MPTATEPVPFERAIIPELLSCSVNAPARRPRRPRRAAMDIRKFFGGTKPKAKAKAQAKPATAAAAAAPKATPTQPQADKRKGSPPDKAAKKAKKGTPEASPVPTPGSGGSDSGRSKYFAKSDVKKEPQAAPAAATAASSYTAAGAPPPQRVSAQSSAADPRPCGCRCQGGRGHPLAVAVSHGLEGFQARLRAGTEPRLESVPVGRVADHQAGAGWEGLHHQLRRHGAEQ